MVCSACEGLETKYQACTTLDILKKKLTSMGSGTAGVSVIFICEYIVSSWSTSPVRQNRYIICRSSSGRSRKERPTEDIEVLYHYLMSLA